MAYLTVAEKLLPSQGLAGGIIVQGSQVEITYGNRTQVTTGGDTVIVGSQIGAASTSPRCPSCGIEIKRPTRFCENCGTKLSG